MLGVVMEGCRIFEQLDLVFMSFFVVLLASTVLWAVPMKSTVAL